MLVCNKRSISSSRFIRISRGINKGWLRNSRGLIRGKIILDHILMFSRKLAKRKAEGKAFLQMCRITLIMGISGIIGIRESPFPL